MNKTNIGFIGAGNMGLCLIKGVLQQNYPPQQIWVTDHHNDKLARLEQEYHLNITENAENLIQKVDILILAIKPKDIKPLLISLKSVIQTRQPLVISIAAGIECEQMLTWLNCSIPLIRAMPNTPALYNVGITGLYASPTVSQEHKTLTEALFKSVGETLWVTNESLMDAITALSGSGPAYFFYMIESLIEGASELGLSENDAKKLAISTGLGALTMAKNATQNLAELRNAVTSKGGTTQAGLNTLEKHGFKEILKATLKAAHLRSKELSASNH